METVTWNTYADFAAVADGHIAEQAGRMAKAMKKGQSTAGMDAHLSMLLLLRRASAHFSPENIRLAFTYLQLNPNV